MKVRLSPSELLREARQRAGLTQRTLAERAGTAQSVVARIENGQTSPSTNTLLRLLEAAGFELRAELVLSPCPDTHMLADIDRVLALTPEQRLIEVRNVNAFVSAARRV